LPIFLMSLTLLKPEPIALVKIMRLPIIHFPPSSITVPDLFSDNLCNTLSSNTRSMSSVLPLECQRFLG
jgi:hypothetical protein